MAEEMNVNEGIEDLEVTIFYFILYKYLLVILYIFFQEIAADTVILNYKGKDKGNTFDVRDESITLSQLTTPLTPKVKPSKADTYKNLVEETNSTLKVSLCLSMVSYSFNVW